MKMTKKQSAQYAVTEPGAPLTNEEWNPIAQIIRQWKRDRNTPLVVFMDAINAVLAKRNVPQPAPEDDDYVAWLRYEHCDNRPTRILMADSDEPGAFKVYRCSNVARPVADARKKWDLSNRFAEIITSDILQLLFDQQITPEKAREWIMERIAGNEPSLPEPVEDSQPVDEDVIERMLVCIYGPKCGVWEPELRRRMADAARIPLDRMRGPGTLIEQQEWEREESWFYSVEELIDRRIDRILMSKKQTPVEMVTELIDAYRGGVAAELAEKIIEKLTAAAPDLYSRAILAAKKKENHAD